MKLAIGCDHGGRVLKEDIVKFLKGIANIELSDYGTMTHDSVDYPDYARKVSESVASGAVESVPFITVTNLARAMRDLKERGVWLIGADQQAERDLYSVRLDGPLAWVLGAEGEGMRRLTRESCDEPA